MLLYRHFGKLKSTYAGNLWLPDPSAGEEECVGVEDLYPNTLFYTGTLFYPGRCRRARVEEVFYPGTLLFYTN